MGERKRILGLIFAIYAVAQATWVASLGPDSSPRSLEPQGPRPGLRDRRSDDRSAREQEAAFRLGSVVGSAAGMWTAGFVAVLLFRWARLGSRGRRGPATFAGLYLAAVLSSLAGLILLLVTATLRDTDVDVPLALLRAAGAAMTLTGAALLGLACTRPVRPPELRDILFGISGAGGPVARPRQQAEPGAAPDTAV